jgi:hypothetical protein
MRPHMDLGIGNGIGDRALIRPQARRTGSAKRVRRFWPARQERASALYRAAISLTQGFGLQLAKARTQAIVGLPHTAYRNCVRPSSRLR